MRIAIIDADLIGRNKHRFPNLVCMKLSGYHKELGNEVSLITDYKQLYYDENIWNEYQKAFEEYAKTYKKMEIKPDVANALGIAQAKCFNEDNIKFDKIFISKVFTDDASCLSNAKQIKEVFSEMVYAREIWQDEV